jgi:hypothetical protein
MIVRSNYVADSFESLDLLNQSLRGNRLNQVVCLSFTAGFIVLPWSIHLNARISVTLLATYVVPDRSPSIENLATSSQIDPDLGLTPYKA